MYTIYINGKIAANIGTISYKDSLDTISTEMNFTTDKVYPLGSQVQLMNSRGEIILTGRVMDIIYGSSNMYSYTVFDYGYYLNKSEIDIQFRDATLKEAIEKLCTQLSIPFGKVPVVDMTINKFFVQKPVSTVLNEILNEASIKLNKMLYFECRNASLNILEYRINNDLRTQLSLMLQTFSKNTISDVTIHESAKDIITRVVVPQYGKIPSATSKDDNLIKRFGLIEKTVQCSETSKEKRQEYCDNYLIQKTKLTKTIKATMLGDDAMQKGVIMSFNEPDAHLIGTFLIVSSNHTITMKSHTVDVLLKEWKPPTTSY